MESRSSSASEGSFRFLIAALYDSHIHTRMYTYSLSVYRSALLGLTLCVTVAACGQNEAASRQPGATSLPVSMIEVQSASVPISAEAVAQTEGAKEVEIRPRVGGILLKRLYEEGRGGKSGPAHVPDRSRCPTRTPWRKQRPNLPSRRPALAQTEREENRLRDLLETQAISQREYDNAVSDNAIARAALQQAEVRVRDAELNLSYTHVAAPVSGISGRFRFSEGALVEANNSLLTTIVQLSPIWVRFSLSDNELAQLGGPLNEQRVQRDNADTARWHGIRKKGELNFAASQIDPLLGTQQLRATFDNSDRRLLPGQFVRARVVTGNRMAFSWCPRSQCRPPIWARPCMWSTKRMKQRSGRW